MSKGTMIPGSFLLKAREQRCHFDPRGSCGCCGPCGCCAPAVTVIINRIMLEGGTSGGGGGGETGGTSNLIAAVNPVPNPGGPIFTLVPDSPIPPLGATGIWNFNMVVQGTVTFTSPPPPVPLTIRIFLSFNGGSPIKIGEVTVPAQQVTPFSVVAPPPALFPLGSGTQVTPLIQPSLQGSTIGPGDVSFTINPTASSITISLQSFLLG